MPHISIEYSANVAKWINLDDFCKHIKEAVVQTGVFELAGIRVRAFQCNHYAIANDNPENGFIDISVRLRAGRPLEIRENATESIFNATKDYLKPILEQKPFALSMEMRDINPDLSRKINTYRNFMTSS